MLSLPMIGDAMSNSLLLGEGFMDPKNLLPMMMFFAAALIIFWVMFRARHRRGRRGGAAAPRRKTDEASEYASRLKRPPPADLDRWSVEMHETARDLSAQIDTKMIALQTLIRSAQEEQAKLQTLLDEVEKKKGEG